MLAPSRRRLVFWAVLRSVLTAAALVVLYYVLPLHQPWNGDTAVRIVIGLLVFASIAVSQVRSIIGSRYPSIRAFEALGLISSLLPIGVRLDLLRDAASVCGEFHPAADPHRRPVLRRDSLLHSVIL